MARCGSGFASSDAWLLLALLYAAEPADRAAITETGDFINHPIFTDEELEGGLGRLLAAGYAIEQDGMFNASPAVLAWFAHARRVSGRMWDEARVSDHLQQVECFLGVGRHAQL